LRIGPSEAPARLQKNGAPPRRKEAVRTYCRWCCWPCLWCSILIDFSMPELYRWLKNSFVTFFQVESRK
jgi:hypothetical protein